MKTIFKKYTLAFIGVLLVSACGKDFLEVEPRGSDLEANYYQNEEEAYKGLVAVYDVVGFMSGGLVTKLGAVNSASDDHFAGGGGPTDMTVFQVWSDYTLDPSVGPQSDLWSKGYSGVFRANVLLSKLPGVPMDEDQKARFVAESRFLRAYFYFDLVRLFKNIPLLSSPVSAGEMYNVTQASPDDVYAFIEQELEECIADLPNTVAGVERARATTGMAHALLGKVYLYREKFAEAASELAIVNGTTPGQPSAIYGYNLVSTYSDLFKTNNEFNSESIFEISFTNTSAGNWGCSACTEGNILNVMSGPRGFKVVSGNEGTVPNYVSGWSFFPITPSLATAMQGDPRFPATIADIGGLAAEGKVEYTPGFMDTGYFLEKFAAKVEDRWTGAGDADLNYPQNIYEIRLADTYLMEAEALVRGGGSAVRAQALLDAVRDRVGLASIPATFENIFNERRLELAGEGHRWFDLVRTDKAAAALGSRGFVAGKHEILPIPLLEMENTKILQSVEWGGSL
ncbi:MAG TPA: RagB/SusD family nutrient uptake outer membrane protein [Chryseolinea sp.]|nr:RagB/SusD family nutrient uptake outer membrane protein [Chryseolinea sp.]HPH45464.1 RagB/SusD family nutrient uptake outer membrane protein [Chryseolinea sp.]HPM30248.1 RagB/SusD family nutrient uptake outer membrane protein [Chryseolinea sp.]